jgi:uncharacterized protein YigE (DUF2233 family)
MNEGAYQTYTITNVIGQVMTATPINTAQTKVNVRFLPAGIYYLVLRGDSGVRVQKFEKE